MPQIVEVPGMGDVEFPDDMSDEQIASAIKANMAPVQPAPADPSLYNQSDERSKAALRMTRDLGRSIGLAGRTILNTFAGAPLMAMNAGVTGRNLLTGSNYQMPSDMWNQALNEAGVPQHQGVIEKGGDILGQMLLGSKLPGPSASQQAPVNFNPQTMKQLALAKAQQDGYVVPPSTVNPSVTNKVLESVGGKIAMEQDASLRNQKVTDSLVKRALGLPEEEILGPGTLDALRAQAGKVYEEIGKTGNVKVDQRFVDDVAKLPKAIADEIAPKVTAIIDSSAGGAIRRGYEETPASMLMQKLRELRFESQRNLSALAAQNPESAKLGKAQKKAAEYVEELLMRHLRANNAGKLADEFADARKLIAQTHTVQKAMNEVTGEINASKLAQQLAKGKPLSGDLRKVAEFSTAFPKASRLVLDSGSVRNTDVILGAGTAALSREPSYLLYPFARQAMRYGLQSDAGQRALTTPGLQPHPSVAMGLLYGQNAGLLGQ